MDDPVVKAKAAAAGLWCERASDHERANAGKPWRYLLTLHDAIRGGSRLAALAAKTQTPTASIEDLPDN
jgi:hypothetical protein